VLETYLNYKIFLLL